MSAGPSKLQRLSAQDIPEPFVQAQTASDSNFSSERDGNIGKASDGWQPRPSELDQEYLKPTGLTEIQLIHYLIAHSFDIPPKQANLSLCEITGIDGTKTRLPCSYRVPLMFVARSQWLALKLVLNASNRVMEWERRKYGILNVSRLCTQLLLAARETIGGLGDVEQGKREKINSKGTGRGWRYPAFDRFLTRCKHRWLALDPENVKKFDHVFGEEEYGKDPLRSDWRRLAVKGHQGFALTQDEVDNGIFAHQMMSGLKEKNNTWIWKATGTPASEGIEGIDAWSLRVTALELSRDTLRLSPFADDESLSGVSDQASKRPGSPLEKAGTTKVGRATSDRTDNGSQARLDTHNLPSCPSAINNHGFSTAENQATCSLARASAIGRSSMESVTTPELMETRSKENVLPQSADMAGQLSNVHNSTYPSQLGSVISITAPPFLASTPGNSAMPYPPSQSDSHVQEVNPYLWYYVTASANSGQAAPMEKPIGRSLFLVKPKSRPEENSTSEAQPHSHPKPDVPASISRLVQIPIAPIQPTSHPLSDSQPNSKPTATTADSEDNAHTGNPLAFASLVGNFVETLPMHSQELRRAMLDGLRDIRTDLRCTVQEEILRSLEEAESMARAAVLDDNQIQAIVERSIQEEMDIFKENLRRDVASKVQEILVPVRSELSRARQDLRRIDEPRAAHVQDLPRSAETGSRSYGQPSSNSRHPLAHLIGHLQ
ncbi:hypothetical protein PM082_018671 [Marasmius tenuissimus]|nr:hypothetical protein PM082_018671 [Marasmius tenuissimus]